MTNKDLIKKYVDTGIALPEYQISKLSNNLKNTYFRKRLIVTKNGKSASDETLLNAYELKLLDDDILKDYLSNRIGSIVYIKDYEFDMLDDEQKKEIAFTKASKGHQINDSIFNYLPDEQKYNYIKLRIEESLPLSINMLNYAGDELTKEYLKNMVKKQFKGIHSSFLENYGRNRDEYVNWFKILPHKLKIFTLNYLLEYLYKNRNGNYRNIDIDDKYYPHLNLHKKEWLKYKINNNGYIGRNAFSDLSDEDKIKYVDKYYEDYKDEYFYPDYMRPYLNKNK